MTDEQIEVLKHVTDGLHNAATELHQRGSASADDYKALALQGWTALYHPSEELITLPKGHQFTAVEEADRIRWAKQFVTRLEGVGQGLGYGIFHGGSLIRDIDIVAVPWQQPTCDKGPVDFVLKLCTRMNLQMGNHWDTIYGHFFVALWAPGHPDHQIDMKVMRPAAAEDKEEVSDDD